MLRHRDFRNFPVSNISGGLLCGIGSSKKKKRRKSPFNLEGLGAWSPKQIENLDARKFNFQHSEHQTKLCSWKFSLRYGDYFLWRIYRVWTTHIRYYCCFLLSQTLNKLSAGALAKALTESINRKRYLLGTIDGGRPPVIGRHQTPLMKRQRPPKLPTGWLNWLGTRLRSVRPGFDYQPDQNSGSLNNRVERAAFFSHLQMVRLSRLLGWKTVYTHSLSQHFHRLHWSTVRVRR